jgi:hypothetical protein
MGPSIELSIFLIKEPKLEAPMVLSLLLVEGLFASQL